MNFSFAISSCCKFKQLLWVAALLAAFVSGSARAAIVESFNGDYVMVLDATADEYQDVFDLLYYLDYEVVWINIEPYGLNVYDEPLLAHSAIFRQVADNSTSMHRFGLTQSEMYSHAESIKDAGGEMMQLEAYRNLTGQIHYAFIAQMNGTSPDWNVILNMSDEMYMWLKDDFDNVVNLCRTSVPGDLRWSVLVKDDKTDTITSHIMLSSGELLAQRNLWEPMGFRMTSLEVLNTWTGYPQYLPVFKRSGSLAYTYERRIAHVKDSTIASFNESQASGMAPVLVAAEDLSSLEVAGAGQLYFRAVWRARGEVRLDIDSDIDKFASDEIDEPYADDDREDGIDSLKR